jgi:hypothetical protein
MKSNSVCVSFNSSFELFCGSIHLYPWHTGRVIWNCRCANMLHSVPCGVFPEAGSHGVTSTTRSHSRPPRVNLGSRRIAHSFHLPRKSEPEVIVPGQAWANSGNGDILRPNPRRGRPYPPPLRRCRQSRPRTSVGCRWTQIESQRRNDSRMRSVECKSPASG